MEASPSLVVGPAAAVPANDRVSTVRPVRSTGGDDPAAAYEPASRSPSIRPPPTTTPGIHLERFLSGSRLLSTQSFLDLYPTETVMSAGGLAVTRVVGEQGTIRTPGVAGADLTKTSGALRQVDCRVAGYDPTVGEERRSDLRILVVEDEVVDAAICRRGANLQLLRFWKLVID